MCPKGVKKLETGEAKIWILLVGVNQYDDEKLNNLKYCARDCQALGEALAAATQQFPEKTILQHHDHTPQPPLLATVCHSLDQLVRAAHTEDTIVFYFSGHGFLDAGQQPFLCLTDTKTDDLKGTGLAVTDLLAKLASCSAQYQLLLLDACHSGGLRLQDFIPQQKGFLRLPSAADPMPPIIHIIRDRARQSQGFYAVLSCDKDQKSLEFPELGHGLFTYYLIRGLQGDAADAEGVITADGLYKYAYHRSLQYIDKTNQQLRLINQLQEAQQKEYSWQTPRRIVEGAGELVLGITPPSLVTDCGRNALVIDGLSGDVGTLDLSRHLQMRGQFALKYLPSPQGEKLRQAISECLHCLSGESPTTQTTTAFLYLRGRLETTAEEESWFVVAEGVRLSLSWLCNQLRESPMSQQVIVLDCPGQAVTEGIQQTFKRWVRGLQLAEDKSQCIIAAAPAEKTFLQILVQILSEATGGLTVAELITLLQRHFSARDCPLETWLSGQKGVIDLLLPGSETADRFDAGICPYKGLNAFSKQDSRFFYGREALTEEILQILSGPGTSFLAVVGASGSGKSSLIQAGVLPNLENEGLFSSEQQSLQQCWTGSFRPGEYPVQGLARLLATTEGELATIEGLLHLGVEGFVLWLRQRQQPMVTLVIDQFEELFTLAGEAERKEFLNLVLGALQETPDRFKLIITLRDDFISACLGIPMLAELVQQSHILVPSHLREGEYKDAIEKPAQLVGLRVESGLVEVLLREAQEASGSLPLLQFILEQLWEHRREGALTLQVYQEEIGGLQGVLEKTAQGVYERLSEERQDCAQWIFLSLVRLGEGKEDTRRRVGKSDLHVPKYSQVLVEETLDALIGAKLIVVSCEDEGDDRGRSRGGAEASSGNDYSTMTTEVTIEIAHEVLIRNWSTLRWWLEENRQRLQVQRQIEQGAKQWQENGRQSDYLLRGAALVQAEELYIKYNDELSSDTDEFISACLDLRELRDKEKRERERQRQWMFWGLTGFSVFALMLAGLAGLGWRSAVENERRAVIGEKNAQMRSRITSLESRFSSDQLDALVDGIAINKELKDADWATPEIRMQGTNMLRQMLERLKEYNRLEGHGDEVIGVAFSPKGDLIASASEDGIKIWKTDGSLVTTLGGHEDDYFSSVAFSPKGDRIASGDEDGTIKIWKTDGSLVSTLEGHSNWVNSVAFSPKGDRIASGDGDGIIKIWKTDGSLLTTLEGHDDWVISVTFSPKGDLIASASEDGTIKIWKTDGSLLTTLEGHEDDYFTSVAFSSKGDRIASGDEDGTIKLWKTDGSLLTTLEGHDDEVISVAFSSKGDRIVSASDDGTIKIWKTDGSLVSTLEGHDDEIISVAFSPKKNLIAAGDSDGTIKLLRTHSSLVTTLEGHEDNHFTRVVFSPKGKHFVSESRDGAIKVWKTDGSLVSTLEGLDHEVNRVAFSPNDLASRVAFSPNDDLIALASRDGTIKIWKTDGSLVSTLEGHDDSYLIRVAFSPKGDLIASAGDRGTIKLWKIEGSLVTTLEGHENFVHSLDFSPKGDLIALRSRDGAINLWKTNGSLVTTIEGDGFVFSPQGDLIASGSYRTIKLWKPDGTLVKTWEGHRSRVACATFSPKGDLIASASVDGTIKLWKPDGTLVKTWEAHRNPAMCLLFTFKGNLIVSASEDGTIKLWKPDGTLVKTWEGHSSYISYLTINPKGDPIISTIRDKTIQLLSSDGSLLTLEDHGSQVYGVAISPNGDRIASASKDGTVRLSNLDLDDLLVRGCDWVRNYLTYNLKVSERERGLCEITPSAELLVRQGMILAKMVDIERAVARFEEALKINPSLDLDPEAETRKLAVNALLKKGKELEWRYGRINEDIAKLLEALKLDSNLKISRYTWLSFCHLGNLNHSAAEVMVACDKIVELEPEPGRFRGIRGISRALTDDIQGAIEDFEANMVWLDSDEAQAEFTQESLDRLKRYRQGWIDALRAGENPIKSLKPEQLENMSMLTSRQ